MRGHHCNPVALTPQFHQEWSMYEWLKWFKIMYSNQAHINKRFTVWRQPLSGLRLNIKHLSMYEISIVTIRQSLDRLIYVMGSLYWRGHFDIQAGPSLTSAVEPFAQTCCNIPNLCMLSWYTIYTIWWIESYNCTKCSHNKTRQKPRTDCSSVTLYRSAFSMDIQLYLDVGWIWLGIL